MILSLPTVPPPDAYCAVSSVLPPRVLLFHTECLSLCGDIQLMLAQNANNRAAYLEEYSYQTKEDQEILHSLHRESSCQGGCPVCTPAVYRDRRVLYSSPSRTFACTRSIQWNNISMQKMGSDTGIRSQQRTKVNTQSVREPELVLVGKGSMRNLLGPPLQPSTWPRTWPPTPSTS